METPSRSRVAGVQAEPAKPSSARTQKVWLASASAPTRALTAGSAVAAISEGRNFHTRPGRHLQWLLGDITDGAGLMRDAPRLQAKRLGLLRVAETLNFYGREYDHPGWEPIKP